MKKIKKAHANKNYVAGASFERAIKKDFEERGFVAVRSAGSHGKFDIWATNGKALFLIQAKLGMSEVAARKELVDLKEYMRGSFPLIFLPIAVLVAVGWTAEHKLKVYGHAYFPRSEQEMKDAVTNLYKQAEEIGAKSN